MQACETKERTENEPLMADANRNKSEESSHQKNQSMRNNSKDMNSIHPRTT